ncbi:hypothetical protein LINGRAHAP2_LOCUS7228 [Linum grandiflorum]
MGLSEQGRVCKKHRSHEEKHGICASCLRDRLSQLNHSSSSSFLNNRDKASSSSYSSSSFSSPTSCRANYEPAENRNPGITITMTKDEKNKKKKKKRVARTHHRSASSTEIGSISFTAEAAAPVINGGGVPNGLKKSRSVAASYSFAPQPARAMSYCVGDDDMGIKNTHQQFNVYLNNKGSSDGGDNYGNEKKKKKGGFWSKLLHLKGKNNSREVMIQQQRKGRVY